MLEGVIFDRDGTLPETRGMCIEAFRCAIDIGSFAVAVPSSTHIDTETLRRAGPDQIFDSAASFAAWIETAIDTG